MILKTKIKNQDEVIKMQAIQSNAPDEIVEVMRKGIGITDSRLAELKIQAQANVQS